MGTSSNEEEVARPSGGRVGDVGGEQAPAQRQAPSAKPALAEALSEDSKKFIGVSRRKQEQLARGDDEVSRKNLKYEALTAGIDGIMDIPEIEDEGREDLSNVVCIIPLLSNVFVAGRRSMSNRRPTI